MCCNAAKNPIIRLLELLHVSLMGLQIDILPLNEVLLLGVKIDAVASIITQSLSKMVEPFVGDSDSPALRESWTDLVHRPLPSNLAQV